MPAVLEAAVLEARRQHPSWGPRRIAFEISKRHRRLAVSESAVIAVCAEPG
jgi:hypothetical protein